MSKSKLEPIEDALEQSDDTTDRKHPFAVKCLLASAAAFTILTTLVFLIVFVGVPLAFKYSITFQRFIIFMPMDTTLEQFDHIHVTDGARNFYITVQIPESITIGALHFLPLPLINESLKDQNFNYTDSLARSEYPTLLHFHGNGGNRFHNLEIYIKLRQYFHVIGFDYQSYGDSTKAELTELGIVEVSIEIYKWLLLRTSSDNLYMWGHSLGGAIAAHTTAKLRGKGITPKGLVLEATFSSLRDEVEHYALAKVFSWLPWFDSTIQEGLVNSGFLFDTSNYALNVDCPIMILHAEDDSLIPYSLAEKLNSAVASKRNYSSQGNVTFHRIPRSYKCNHWSIPRSPEFSTYLSSYLMDCEKYYNQSKVAKKQKNY